MELKGKTALVTGASSGIGFGIACDLNKAGCKVIINSRSKKKLEAASKKIPGSIPIHADITCPEQSKILLKKVRLYIDSIDILICNVGSGSSVAPGKESYKLSYYYKIEYDKNDFVYDLINGNNHYFLADQDLINNPAKIKFHIENNWHFNDLNYPIIIPLKNFTSKTITWENLKIAFVDKNWSDSSKVNIAVTCSIH